MTKYVLVDYPPHSILPRWNFGHPCTCLSLSFVFSLSFSLSLLFSLNFTFLSTCLNAVIAFAYTRMVVATSEATWIQQQRRRRSHIATFSDTMTGWSQRIEGKMLFERWSKGARERMRTLKCNRGCRRPRRSSVRSTGRPVSRRRLASLPTTASIARFRAGRTALLPCLMAGIHTRGEEPAGNCYRPLNWTL